MNIRHLALACTLALTGCAATDPIPDLGAIYNTPAQNIGGERNPVVVLPGILGSRLEDPDSATLVWGAFIRGAADADTPGGARMIALPMREGVPLIDSGDTVVPTEVLDTLAVDVAFLRGELSAYVDILKTLNVGKYRDQSLGRAAAIDYGGLHYTCFQYAYDWRRDVSEQAAALHVMIQDAIALQPGDETRKVDVIAHSMGGLVLRYYLRYGPDPLPRDGSLPELDWEGARYVENAILIGTPSGGSVLALEQLVEGINFASFITPTYRPAVLGTMPAIYQLLPRTRHARVVEASTGDPIDLFDPEVWIRYEWGLADPDQDAILRWLLPDVSSAEDRRRIALDHLQKSLAKAEQLHRALDLETIPPVGLGLHLVAGDAHPTPDVIAVDSNGRLSVRATGPGDNTVTRESALMDERTGRDYSPRVQSPIHFEDVLFLRANHLGLTKDPIFVNHALYTLLEKPRVRTSDP